ncbi:hypothetical protein BD410DRAFT_648195 [Rickenella mellea]|uniref:DUF6534 domain-containing protein n=1 Tax=Rickenella mellea TaxID=50990 RepID=A0A4Y7PL65_9AGAM|nr:hypothetical protein BD410DRAFT_648195 [Rickenella mellea]
MQFLMLYGIERCGLVTFAQVAVMILYFAFAKPAPLVPIHLCLSKLYVNTLLAILNARRGYLPDAGNSNYSQQESSVDPKFAAATELATQDVRISIELHGVRSLASNPDHKTALEDKVPKGIVETSTSRTECESHGVPQQA